jgi:RHS repeat-associated protein
VKQFTYGHDLISQTIIGGSVSFYSYDGHGSVRQLTDASASITDTYDYDAFGILINSTGTTPNDYLHTGEKFDGESRFYYLRARYLSPSTARFLTSDSYEGDNYDPASVHKYLYVGNDPVNKIDPSGKSALAEQLATVNVSAIISAMSAIRNIVIAAAIACTLTFAVTGALNESGVPIGGGTPCDARNPEHRVYRGTNRVLENQIFDLTGHLLSDAAQETYAETGSIVEAYASALETHLKWIQLWGNELFYAQAHGAFGTEMPRVFGMPRTFVSVTTSLDIARSFARGGRVYSAVVPRWQMVPQGFLGAGEGEWLIRLGRPGFSVYQ